MRRLPLVLGLVTLLFLAACAQGREVVTQDVVETIPWSDREQAQYVILDKDDEEEIGRGTIGARRTDGQYELRFHFEGEGTTDESVVLVEATTLKPDTVRREVRGQDESVVVNGVYKPDEEIVEITETRDSDERTVPLRLEENYYDNESSLFVWRTVPFREDYEASYHSVLANFRRTALITVRVVGREELTVPAGAFDTWKLEIRSGSVEQVAWYADAPGRALVQYDNSRGQIFQLTSIELE